jgi:flavin prenyltransferase
MGAPSRLVVGISGASGAVYGVRLLEVLQPVAVETHLIVSKAAEQTLALETDFSLDDVRALADVFHPTSNLGAAVSSGSFETLGMIVAPCSARSLAEIANGGGATLLTRAADVVLKERRRLVLMFRETPLHRGHLHNMEKAAKLGAIIAPPVPAFYAKPKTLEDMIDHSLGRVLDLFGIETELVKRWEGG